MLSAEELRRAESAGDDAAYAHSVVTSAFLRLATAMLTGMPPGSIDIGHWCRGCAQIGDHGRPVAFDPAGRTLPRVFLSAAHAGDAVMVVASAHGPVGVDVEPVDEDTAGDLADAEALAVLLSPAELEIFDTVPPEERLEWWLRTWVRKQALLKATGHGLTVPPSRLDVTGGTLRAWPPMLADDIVHGVHLIDYSRTAPGHLAAIAFLGARRPLVIPVRARDLVV
jgi:4'-phosphopantetheinyl transferase